MNWIQIKDGIIDLSKVNIIKKAIPKPVLGDTHKYKILFQFHADNGFTTVEFDDQNERDMAFDQIWGLLSKKQ